MPVFEYRTYRISVSPYQSSGKWKCRATWFKFTKENPDVGGLIWDSPNSFETEQEAINGCLNHVHQAIDSGKR